MKFIGISLQHHEICISGRRENGAEMAAVLFSLLERAGKFKIKKALQIRQILKRYLNVRKRVECLKSGQILKENLVRHPDKFPD